MNDLAFYWHTRNRHWEGKLRITEGAILLRQGKLDEAWAVLQRAKPLVLKADLPFLNTQLGCVMERRGLLDKATITPLSRCA